MFAVGSVSLLAPQQKAFAASSGNSRVSAASLKLADKVKRTIPRGALSTLESARRIRDELKNTKIRNVQKSALADSGAVVHKVRSGETLVEIAGRYGMPVETLVQTNDLDDPDDIQAKEAIVVPKAQSA
ncbi:MAG: LysM domain-containing protein, partial [Cyanobacteria bacterium P01_F01_bin.42]